MTALNDLTEQRFGSLTVLRRAANKGAEAAVAWQCRCDCGTEKSVRAAMLRKGKARSCGCMQPSLISEKLKSHGLSTSRTYNIWNLMIQRCTNQRDKRWKNYGGRGITVCEKWRKFDGFLADMGEAPKGMSIDRFPDNDGNYERNNCRWATDIEQGRNKRNNHVVELNGERRCISEWCEVLGLKEWRVRGRISRYGWDAVRALTT